MVVTRVHLLIFDGIRQESVQLLLRHSVVDEVFLKIGGDRMDWLMVPIDIILAVLQPVVPQSQNDRGYYTGVSHPAGSHIP